MWQGLKNIYHLFVAIFASLWYGFPSKKLTVIGVTGTDGKTTTVSLIYHILNVSNHNASMISSIGAYIENRHYDVGFHVTNPSSFPLQCFIKQAAAVSKYLVLEVTSHGLDQNRVYGIHFAVGVITNVTHEHLDYHKTYENYLTTKLKLLKYSGIAVVNRDDMSYKAIKNKAKAAEKLITFGMKTNASLNPKNFVYQSSLIGEFNTYNILAAAAVCKALGISDKEIKDAIKSFSSPIGRQDIVYDKDFIVMIDFAHTPNAFAKMLPEARKRAKRRVIHVFGAASKRDTTKRPLMGKESSRYADVIILTAEDPRNEPIENIMNEIQKGIPSNTYQEVSVSNIESIEANSKKKYLLRISDRTEAIRFAISLAKKGDVVFLSGKSHEKSMNYGKGEEPWDEYKVVKDALLEKGAPV